MKKMMMTFAAVLCCAMTMTVFTACGSDDDDNKKPGSQQEQSEGDVLPGKLASGASTFGVTFTGFETYKAMAADGKVMIRYTYQDGLVKTEEITSSSKFEKTVEYSLTDKGEIIASFQVYLNDINEEKAREILGTEYMNVVILGALVLKHDNGVLTTHQIKQEGYFKTFERTSENLNTVIDDLKKKKEKQGLIPLVTYGVKCTDTSEREGTTWIEK
jgi:hypothetical protein